MPASSRRRSLRQFLGANRKLRTFRWIGQRVVEIRISRVSRRGCVDRSKAVEGAEKSCRRRRKARGLRRGKLRARGRHPRDPDPPAPGPENVADRTFARRLRAIDYWYDRVQQFRKLLGQARLVFLSPERDGGRYAAWKTRWEALSSRIRPFGEEVVWCSRIGPSFDYYLEQQLGIIVNGSGLHASRTLREWKDEVPCNRNLSWLTGGPAAPVVERDLLLPRVVCGCKACRVYTLCPQGHGISAGDFSCQFCGYHRHSGRPVVRSTRYRGGSRRRGG